MFYCLSGFIKPFLKKDFQKYVQYFIFLLLSCYLNTEMYLSIFWAGMRWLKILDLKAFCNSIVVATAAVVRLKNSCNLEKKYFEKCLKNIWFQLQLVPESQEDNTAENEFISLHTQVIWRRRKSCSLRLFA